MRVSKPWEEAPEIFQDWKNLSEIFQALELFL
jgi:hypothetical protein